MNHFRREGGQLLAEQVPLTDVASAYGTPTYVYSRATIRRHVRVLQEGLAGMAHLICYAVKANANLGILRLLAGEGVYFDGVSLGELRRVQAAGGDLSKTIFSGVGKRDDEIAAALEMGVLYISAESPAEVLAIGELARAAGKVARVSLRINPEVDAATHPYISTGLVTNKFGVATAHLPALLARLKGHNSLKLVGLSCHIGSQVTTLSPFRDAAQIMRQTCRDVQQAGFALAYVGMGGGLGIPYADETPPSPEAYGACLRDTLGGTGLTLVLEPGRVLVGNAGVLLSRVVRVKDNGVHLSPEHVAEGGPNSDQAERARAPRTFVVLDAGMNDLLRPALYQAHHGIEPVLTQAGAPLPVDVVGPVCESADTFVSGAQLPPLAAGDLVALRSAGAYGMAMASTYNARPRPAEVLCDGATMTLIGRRERIDELWRLEQDL